MMAFVGLGAPRAWALTAPPKPHTPVRALRTRLAKQFTGDFDGMVERRLIRVIVPYSRTLYFQDKGAIYGTAADGAQLLETWLNKKNKLGARFLTVPVSAASRDKLFDALLAGDADIAAGDITVTEERRKKVAFTDPVINNVREVVITAQDVPDLDSPEALSGREVAVSRSTTFYESLLKLNEKLTAANKPPVKITIVPDTLEPEDLMEMTAAGLLPATVCDDWIANLWVQIYKGLKTHPKAALREGAEIAWAVRPNNPKLLATLNQAIAEIAGDATKWSNRTQVYLASLKQLHTAADGADMQRFRDTIEIFRRYAGQYRFDTLMLVALGYEESRLEQQVRSSVGAVGLMQVMPKTGQAMGVGNIYQADFERPRRHEIAGDVDRQLFQRRGL